LRNDFPWNGRTSMDIKSVYLRERRKQKNNAIYFEIFKN
jgi:hypothetical protein